MKVIIDDHISTEENPIKVYIQGVNDEEFMNNVPRDARQVLSESEDFSNVEVSMQDGYKVDIQYGERQTLNAKRKEYDEFLECTSGEFYYESPDATDDDDVDLLNGCINNGCENSKDKKFIVDDDDDDDECDACNEDETYKKSLGKIVVYDKLGHINGTELEGAQINLYKLTGVNPMPISKKMTDSCGKAVFDGLEDGNYRVIAIVDKRYFERPEYFRWNEITIDCTNKDDTVIVVNKIRAGLRVR